MKNIYLLITIACLFLNFNKLFAQTETFWTGTITTFTKTDFSDWNLEANQDRITENVWITRANSQGLFNIAPEKETAFDDPVQNPIISPMDTKWANGTINDGIGNLTFTTWDDSNWDEVKGKPNPSSQIDVNKVLHLITDDIYIDFVLRSWSKGDGTGTDSGGGFSYERTTDQSLSTNEYELNNTLNIYPNPSHDFIQITGLTSAQNFKVHNVLGAEILQGNVEKEGEINIQNLVKGIYVIHFENGTALKFVKN